MLLFNFAGLFLVYALQRLQQFLPLNPQGFPAIAPDSSFNTAVSFASNTNWQGYGGETTMSYLTQMAGLTVQNFVSAATGMAVLALFIRGLARHSVSVLFRTSQGIKQPLLHRQQHPATRSVRP
jgi:K+-transporting ATPase ATPase A chain